MADVQTDGKWAYELWVHLSDHVNQQYGEDEPDDCEHCRDAEVDCDDCRKLLVDWEASLDPETGASMTLPTSTHQKMRGTLEQIFRQTHPPDQNSTCAGLPHCPGCLARSVLYG